MPSIKVLIAEATEQLATSSDSSRLDAEVLLCFVLGKTRSYLRAWCDNEPTDEQCAKFLKLIQQRQQGIPVAYLTGMREFWSRDFIVTPDVLIPRPDTELLIELSLQLIPEHQSFHIIDLGTGSGIIAVTLAVERPNARITAVDTCLAALAVARHNARYYQLTNIDFYQSYWFDHVLSTPFDLVISNPPYIAKDDEHLQQGDVRFEPKIALGAEEQGLRDINTSSDNARRYLAPKGHLLIEHGCDQAAQVQALFKVLDYDKVQSYKDLSGNSRVSYGQKP